MFTANDFQEIAIINTKNAIPKHGQQCAPHPDSSN
jgi:hypothetical protein